VLHHCDNPPCCNPAHLYLGTVIENVRDRVERDRGVKGERVNTNKLTEDEVRAIRYLCDEGWVHRDIANAFGVTPAMVGYIARRQSWQHLPEHQLQEAAA
jgi:hypothetical protein